jgi:hypothetical protein
MLPVVSRRVAGRTLQRTIRPCAGATSYIHMLNASGSIRLASVVLALAAATLTSAIAAPEPARKADEFIDSIGVNAHWGYYGTPYDWGYADQTDGRPGLKSRLGELGLRHIRDGAHGPVYTRVNDLYASFGIKHTMLTGRRFPGPWPQPLDVSAVPGEIAEIKANVLAATAAIEGPNEYDLSKPSGEDWVTKVRNYQTAVYSAVSGDSAFDHIPVIAPSLTHPNSYQQLGNISHITDHACVHLYQSSRYPGNPGWGGPWGSIPWGIGMSRDVQAPGRPLQSTECGYQNSTASDPVPESIEARYLPRTFAEFYRHGIARSFKYEMVDLATDPANPDHHFGLLRNDLSPKPSFHVLKNLIALLKDPNPTFTPATLDYSLSGDLTNIHSLLFQKGNGRFYLMLWQEVQASDYVVDWWMPTYSGPRSLTLNLTTPIASAVIHQPLTGAAPIGSATNPTSVALSVPDHLTIIELVPSNHGGVGSITREVWTGVGGYGISGIPVNTVPSFADQLASFEAPTNWADSYGTRVRGFVIPPASGAYTFWIASDDTSELWLSTTSSPANKTRIAFVNGWTEPRQWTKYASQQSVTINLVAGQRYYIEALQKEGTGGDNLAVAWQGPGISQQVISGSALAPYASGLGTLNREVWTNAGGYNVWAIPVNTLPNLADQLTSFEGPTNWADNYGSRVRALIIPPSTGAYTFWIATDDCGELWLSADENPTNKTRIAHVDGWTNPREWNKYPSQQSTTISLVAGRRYYIEALHKEGNVGDNFAVAWQGPGISQQVIPGLVLCPYAP